MATNPYEMMARHAKAMAFAHHLHQHGIVSADVRLITSEQWKELASAMTQIARTVNKSKGRINPPSAETIAEIEDVMHSMELVPSMSAEECFRRCKS